MTHSVVWSWIKCTSNPNKTFTKNKASACSNISLFTMWDITAEAFHYFLVICMFCVMPSKNKEGGKTKSNILKIFNSTGKIEDDDVSFDIILNDHLPTWLTCTPHCIRDTHTSKLTSTESKHSCLRLLTHDRTWTRLRRFSDTNVPGVIFFSVLFYTALHCHTNTADSYLQLWKWATETQASGNKVKTKIKNENQAVNWRLLRGRKMGME